ncbi:MAG: hypothetical protein AVDCRST_MAG70-1107, partial [uncultured Thermomicrobiales bacterium]
TPLLHSWEDKGSPMNRGDEEANECTWR